MVILATLIKGWEISKQPLITHERHLKIAKEVGDKSWRRTMPMVILATLIKVWEISKQPLITMNVI